MWGDVIGRTMAPTKDIHVFLQEDMMMEVVVRLQLLALKMEEGHEPGNEGPF